MLSLEQIEQYYPKNAQSFKKNLLREYIQYKILEIIFNSKLTDKLSFLGGTALRIVYDNTRFSEDLDFDNLGFNQKNFSLLMDAVKTGLEKEGYAVEIRGVFKDAYRCYIKIPKILFDSQLAGTAEQKIVIQVDTAPHDFAYTPEDKVLNKFDVFTKIFVTPLDILLAQKFYAIFNRKRAKGRDYFDIIFLLKKTKPNYDYLKLKMNIQNAEQLKGAVATQLKLIDLDEIIRDVRPFLFNPDDSKQIKLFGEYIQQAVL